MIIVIGVSGTMSYKDNRLMLHNNKLLVVDNLDNPTKFGYIPLSNFIVKNNRYDSHLLREVTKLILRTKYPKGMKVSEEEFMWGECTDASNILFNTDARLHSLLCIS